MRLRWDPRFVPDAGHEAPAPPSSAARLFPRPQVRGKFLSVNGDKFWIRGVTYGTFRPTADGTPYPAPEVVEGDFSQMAGNGLNALRTYTVPPRWFLDAAQRHGLRVLVGLPWEQHTAFLDDRARAAAIERRIREGVGACAGHPAVLAYAIGNEIPTSIVRWYGYRRVERYVERLYRAAKAEDSDGLFTYVNYPSTEYLQLPFIDLVCFNVYLESEERFAKYMARLQNLADDRPLIMTELGLDSRSHGEPEQAQALDWQLRTTFRAGSAGAFVFAWTDEWYRGGYDIDGWDFGLTSRDRRPKLALQAARTVFAEAPFPSHTRWPRVSVIVCTHNGARTIRDCLAGLQKLEYPNFEVIVINDGSTDRTAEIVREFDVRRIDVPCGGLGAARNRGLDAATGEIVAYIDDDAWPDSLWLKYLAATFLQTPHAGVGGPNLPPPGQGFVAECVAKAPGGPIHVLLTDEEAEHIPGCNMAFRKAALQAIGGFDPQFRVAGDDVDVCWRIRERGWTLGYSPGATVWHRRRNSVRAYWRQQRSYGAAEALLERKWPEKYNSAGHLSWAGRVYGNSLLSGTGWGRRHIYEGTWGTALFKSVYGPGPSLLQSLPAMPEWYVGIVLLVGLGALGLIWRPLLWVLPLFGLALGASLVHAWVSAAEAVFPSVRRSVTSRLAQQTVTAVLHVLQPLARLSGRLGRGLAPWRRRGVHGFGFPRPQTFTLWSERWQSATERLLALEAALVAERARVHRGGDYDTWDLEVRDGAFGAIRTLLAIEEHGAGKQLVRLRAWARTAPVGGLLMGLFTVLGVWAAVDRAWVACGTLGAIALLLSFRTLHECGVAMAAVRRVVRDWEPATTARAVHSSRAVSSLGPFQRVAQRERYPAVYLPAALIPDPAKGEEHQ